MLLREKMDVEYVLLVEACERTRLTDKEKKEDEVM